MGKSIHTIACSLNIKAFILACKKKSMMRVSLVNEWWLFRACFCDGEESTIDRKIILIFHASHHPIVWCDIFLAVKEKMNWFFSIQKISSSYGRRNAGFLSPVQTKIPEVQNPLIANKFLRQDKKKMGIKPAILGSTASFQ